MGEISGSSESDYRHTKACVWDDKLGINRSHISFYPNQLLARTFNLADLKSCT